MLLIPTTAILMLSVAIQRVLTSALANQDFSETERSAMVTKTSASFVFKLFHLNYNALQKCTNLFVRSSIWMRGEPTNLRSDIIFSDERERIAGGA